MRYDNVYKKLADFGRDLLNDTSYEKGLPRIAKYAKEVIGAHRCSIFINDLQKGELWTPLSDGIEKIIIPSDKGLVGHTIRVKEPLIENNPYSNPHFLSDIDKESGYVTKNIVTAPVFNSQREIIGVIQLLNKEEGFDKEDLKFMIFFAHYVSGYLELMNLWLREDSKNK
ncbi:GAF domain-containing protein [Sulfurimonas sp. CS5]|uniref:GAF domain-containing protein n=1 Tax=Sulfurimonas sp. CS5 TaxID=3391145 RepID=UPI0039EB34C9